MHTHELPYPVSHCDCWQVYMPGLVKLQGECTNIVMRLEDFSCMCPTCLTVESNSRNYWHIQQPTWLHHTDGDRLQQPWKHYQKSTAKRAQFLQLLDTNQHDVIFACKFKLDGEITTSEFFPTDSYDIHKDRLVNYLHGLLKRIILWDK